MSKKDLINSITNTDNMLAVEAQAGDMAAEETLMRKYSGIVKGKAKAYYMVGADADDVIQEGMIGLMKAIRSFNPEKKATFATFAEVCITRQIISAIRKANRIKHKPLNTSVSLNRPIASDYELSGGENDGVTLGDTLYAADAYSPEAMLIIKDVTAYILYNGDNVFSDFEMQVLSEAIKGYTYDQIADKLGKSKKSIDNALQRTKRKVNDYLWS